ncbi:MAG: hypothetical protein K2Z81_17020 [Cyanobacteria bacterium]|nr:hypothetical protein [Cyanobacteriota bacterium]
MVASKTRRQASGHSAKSPGTNNSQAESNDSSEKKLSEAAQLISLANTHEASGEYEKARGLYEKAATLFPNRKGYLDRLYKRCIREKKFDQAIICVQSYMKFGKTSCAQRDLAALYLTINKEDMALKELEYLGSKDFDLRTAYQLSPNSRRR